MLTSKPTLSPRPSFLPVSPCVSVNKDLVNESTRAPLRPPAQSNDHPSFFEAPQFPYCAPILPLPLCATSCLCFLITITYLPRLCVHCGLWPLGSHPNHSIHQTEAVAFLDSLRSHLTSTCPASLQSTGFCERRTANLVSKSLYFWKLLSVISRQITLFNK